FPEAKVEPIDSEEVEQFCRQADYDWKTIEPGQLEIPPEKNVEELNWEEEKAETIEVKDVPEEETTMASDELERIRQQFEGLL
ncbi:MAG: DUF3110 domain-containing protein, partial [Pleurocapsa sp.]